MNSNVSTRAIINIMVSWHMKPCSLLYVYQNFRGHDTSIFGLQLKTASFFLETFVLIYETTRRHTQKDCNPEYIYNIGYGTLWCYAQHSCSLSGEVLGLNIGPNTSHPEVDSDFNLAIEIKSTAGRKHFFLLLFLVVIRPFHDKGYKASVWKSVVK